MSEEGVPFSSSCDGDYRLTPALTHVAAQKGVISIFLAWSGLWSTEMAVPRAMDPAAFRYV